MRYSLAAALALALCPTALWAQSDLAPDKQWIETVDGSLSLPVSPGASQAFDPSFGGDIAIGYRFTANFSLSLDSGYYQFGLKNPPAGSDTTFSYVPLMVVARYNLMEGQVHPYVFWGAGAAINTTTVSPSAGVRYSSTQTGFLTSPGVGMLVRVADGAALFVQGRLDIDFVPPGSPASADGSALFFPIQAGASFFVL